MSRDTSAKNNARQTRLTSIKCASARKKSHIYILHFAVLFVNLRPAVSKFKSIF